MAGLTKRKQIRLTEGELAKLAMLSRLWRRNQSDILRELLNQAEPVALPTVRVKEQPCRHGVKE